MTTNGTLLIQKHARQWHKFVEFIFRAKETHLAAAGAAKMASSAIRSAIIAIEITAG